MNNIFKKHTVLQAISGIRIFVKKILNSLRNETTTKKVNVSNCSRAIISKNHLFEELEILTEDEYSLELQSKIQNQ